MMKNFKFFIVLFLIFFQIIESQNLLVSSKENIYDKELNSIKRGKINSYQSLRYLYEWNNNKTKNDLLISELGKEFLRNQRFKIFPEINLKSTLNGGFVEQKNKFLDFYPRIIFLTKYNFTKSRKFSILFWSSLEKHSLISNKNFSLYKHLGRPVIDKDFSSYQAVGYTDFSGDDFSWIEYRIGDGGILLNYPGGDISFTKNLPIWSSGYSGQLWLSEKPTTFPFLSLRHNISNNWSFSYLHGSLNSNIRDSSFATYYDSALPMIPKKISVHRLDFFPTQNIRLSIGESIIYAARNFEMNYSIPFLPFWTAQSDLSNSDNLQLIFDGEYIKKKIGRIYGTLFVDEWDFVDTFNKKKNRNWFAFLIGSSLKLKSNSNFNPIIRFEFSRISPYVYIHKSSINDFTHHGMTLGHWSGSNSQNIFFSYEGKLKKKLWMQIYFSYAERGEVNDYTINTQYNHEQVSFLYKEYEGDPENRIVYGIRGNLNLVSNVRLNFNFFKSDWENHIDYDNNKRKNTFKIDSIINISIGL